MFSRKILRRAFANSNTHLDPYKILNVAKNASEKDIKKSYIKLVKQWHPDKTDDGGAMFKQIQESYTILTDPKKKLEWE